MVRLQYFYSLSVGASGAGASYRKLIVIKIIMEDEISGYCVMVSYNSRNWMGQETTYNHYFLYHLFHYFSGPRVGTTFTSSYLALSTSPTIHRPISHLLAPWEEQENLYQTPRKSIISIDDKIPSYYPNSCDTEIFQRHHNGY
ncbi:hypothetical protein CVS40_5585 [Lucilia cuprina]|nr:hypothetical protein CVS40_5585 [Lucilia cuprina]